MLLHFLTKNTNDPRNIHPHRQRANENTAPLAPPPLSLFLLPSISTSRSIAELSSFNKRLQKHRPEMSSSDEDNRVFEALCSHVVPFPCPIPAEDEEAALDQMVPGRAEVVLLGEATHGTEEFYQLRRLLTKHLILERGFRAILLEVRGLCL